LVNERINEKHEKILRFCNFHELFLFCVKTATKRGIKIFNNYLKTDLWHKKQFPQQSANSTR